MDTIGGVLFGTAVGDALGLPWEGLPAHRIPRGAAFPLGRGYLSDDTEQTAILAQAVLDSGGDLARFRSGLARGLRTWLLAVPPGIGFGTLRALVRLLVGVPPDRSGVFSAGNGAAMRAAVLGLVAPPDALVEWVHAACHVTHRDPRAVDGALVVALAARLGALGGHAGKRTGAPALLDAVRDPELRARVGLAITAAEAAWTPDAFAAQLGIGGFISGFVSDTVPTAIFLWLRFDDLTEAVQAAVHLGGDTDSVAAITGALCGATGGRAAVPEAWVAQIAAGPVSRAYLSELADALRSGGSVEAPRWHARLVWNLTVLPRFVVFLAIRRFVRA